MATAGSVLAQSPKEFVVTNHERRLDAKAPDLLKPEWRNVDPIELRIVLKEYVGGPGQYDDREKNPDRLYLPLARDACIVVLTFSGREIVAMEPGPAFDPQTWQQTAERIDTSLFAGPSKIGREYSFSSFRVEGSWRGDRSGVQIIPAPSEAPRARYEVAEHPFIVEFVMKESDLLGLTLYRRMREHVNLTRLLNVLLRGHTRSQSRRPNYFWASITRDDGEQEIKWVQEFYIGKLDSAIADGHSAPSRERLTIISADEYYSKTGGLDGLGLRVPSDLDESIVRYKGLKASDRAKFERAAFWLDCARRQWNTAISATFASLVSAVEALAERSGSHHFDCPVCQRRTQHEFPGATRRFVDFLQTYAPGKSQAKTRREIYSLRSGILHGSQVIALDDDAAFGWDPPWYNERELTDDLWRLTRIAVRNWLLAAEASVQ